MHGNKVVEWDQVDKTLMKEALNEAREALARQEVPIG